MAHFYKQRNCTRLYWRKLPIAPTWRVDRNQMPYESLYARTKNDPRQFKFLRSNMVSVRHDISGQGLTELPALPENVTYLNCKQNEFTELPPLPDTLQHLLCDRNRLVRLPPLPKSLITLTCSNNQLVNLPDLPPTLERLECVNNVLTALPAIPPGITKLWCDDNRIESLPVLPIALTNFGISNNRIRTMGPLPNTLEYFWCDSNELTVLPPIPNTLRKLYCQSNNLSLLPELPNTIELECEHNPWVGRFSKYMSHYDPLLATNMYYAERRAIRRRARSLYRLRSMSIPISYDLMNHVGTFLSGKVGLLSHQIQCLKQWI